MNSITVGKTTEGEDYLSEPVPQSDRKPGISVLIVFVGFIVVAGQMVVGGGLAAQLSGEELVIAVLVGNGIAGIFAAVAGYTGAHSGQSFNQLLADAFPDWSHRAASLYVPVVLMGWYAIEASIFGSLVASVLEVGDLASRFIIFFCGLGFATTAYFGFRSLRIVSTVAVPLLLVIGIYAMYLATTTGDARYGFGDTHIDMPSAIAIVVGSWIMGALTCVPDITRFSRTLIGGAAVGFVGIFVGNSFNHFVGGAGAALAQQADPALILIGLGLVAPALLFAIANIWTTNDSNMYSASLNLAPVLNINRRTAVLICTLFGAAIAIVKPHEVGKLFTFLGFLGATAPALGAVVLARYWWPKWGFTSPSTTSLPAWLGWLGGTTLAFILPSEWAYLVGFGSAMVIYYCGLLAFGENGISRHPG